MSETIKDYSKTKRACYLGFVTQAIVANFAPLLFIAFHREFDIPIASLALIPAVFYAVQLITDFLCAKFKNIDYRKNIIISEITSALGLAGLAFVPALLPNPLVGVLICVCIYAVGSGLIEVLCSPIIEACPFPNKEGMMSLLHSFYCWGAVGVIIGSTLFFTLFGLENWRLLACLWALIPLYNIINFATCPIEPIVQDSEGMSMKQLLTNRMFWLFLLLMIATGASESSMAQWTSAFAEASLGVDKSIGDLAGPCGFAFCMGLGRLWYGKKGQKMDLSAYMTAAGILCFAAYLTASLSTVPIVAFVGCMICGMAVSIMWPGSISLTSAQIPGGGTALFALLALAGDVGGTLGPSLVGLGTQSSENDIQSGLLAASAFPILLVISLLCIRRKKAKTKDCSSSR
ncbi:MAG: MFS transporter [Bacteroidaceae bacterium]|nr:MFS transporter [Bacteroidaceae bacterium]